LHILFNQQIIPQEKASIPIDDRAFRYGDGLFETLRIIDQQPLWWDEHIARLETGMKILNLVGDLTNLKNHCQDLINKNNISDGVLRIALSRGSGGRGYLPLNTNPLLIAETLPLPPALPEKIILALSKWRSIPPACLPNPAKLSQGLNHILAAQEASPQFAALQLSIDEKIACTSSHNIFWLKNDILHTPSLETGCLAGIARAKIIQNSPWEIQTGLFDLKELLAAKGVIISNSLHLCIGVDGLKNYQVDWRKSGELADKISSAILIPASVPPSIQPPS